MNNQLIDDTLLQSPVDSKSCDHAAASADWLKTTRYKIHLDLHTPDWHKDILTGFDARQIISNVRRSGARCLYFFAKDSYGNAYYNTGIGRKHPCIGPRDLLREIIELGHDSGIRVMAYVSVIWDNHVADHHPDWCMRDRFGNPLMDSITQDIGKWKYLCHNTQYTSHLSEILREITKNYDVDGFHLDMLNMDFGRISCYCDCCRELFRRETGMELPLEPSTDLVWRTFLEFRYRSVEKMALALRNAILECKADLPVIMNYHGSPNFDWRAGQKPVQHSDFSAVSTGETYTPMFGDMYPGLESRFIRDLVPGRTSELASWRMNRGTDFTIKPAAQLKWELMTSLANGVNTMLIDQTFADGWLDEVTYDRLNEVFHEIDAKEQYWGGEPIRHVAIYYSCKTRDLYGLNDQRKFLLPVMGAYKALIESHFNVAFLFDETLSIEQLRQYPVVFLPNTAVLSRRECLVLTQYVQEGGHLIATNETSLYDDTGGKLNDFQLASVFGVNFSSTADYEEHYLRDFPGDLGNGIDPRYHILNSGPFHHVVPATAKSRGDLHAPFFKRRMPDQFFSHNMHPPYLREGSAMFINDFGQGKAVYLPHGIDASYANLYEIPEQRILLRNLVSTICDVPFLSINAPLNVETSIMRKNDCILVHFVQFNPLRRSLCLPSLNQPVSPSTRMEEAGIYRATVELKFDFNSVKAFHAATSCRVQGQTVRLTCENVHEVLEIRL